MSYITGSAEKIEKIHKILTSKSLWHLGYGRSSEYGAVRIKVLETSIQQPKAWRGKRFAVQLLSPAIIYNDKAFYSTDPKDLIEEILAALNIDAEAVSEYGHFINYISVGGYHVTWKKRKPVIEAFDKGSVVWFAFKEDRELVLPPGTYIGERCSEGYGEIAVIQADEENGRYKGQFEKARATAATNVNFDVKSVFSRSICEERFAEYIDHRALKAALENITEKDADYKPIIRNMLLMVKENSSMAALKEAVDKRFKKKTDKKQEKLNRATRLLSIADGACKSLTEDFCSEMGVTGFYPDPDAMELKFLSGFLSHMKYILHQKEVRTRHE